MFPEHEEGLSSQTLWIKNALSPLKSCQAQVGTHIALQYLKEYLKASDLHYALEEFILTDIGNDLHLHKVQKNLG